MQLDGESEPFGGARQDKENDSFLDCDWANIDDFDDLDRIFRYACKRMVELKYFLHLILPPDSKYCFK